jgi:hypothetical protein
VYVPPLPAASILAIVGLGFAATKVDSGFAQWFQESGALVRVRGDRMMRSIL